MNNMTKDELLALTNNAKRQAVLDAWREWPVWEDVPALGLTVRRLMSLDGSAFTAAWYAGDDFYPGCGTRNVNKPRFAIMAPGKTYLPSDNSGQSTLVEHLMTLRKKVLADG